MKKSELNQNIRISESNVKLNNLKDQGVVFLTFSLPSIKTCPYATNKCKSNCFGNRGVFAMPNNRKCYERNYEETKKDSFVTDVINHLEYQLERKKMIGNIIYLRIHQTGDFYSKAYFKKWKEISDYFIGDERIKFQAYTKSIDFVDLEANIQLIFSQMVDTKPAFVEKAKSLDMPIYNTVEMKIEDFEDFKKINDYHYCEGNCETCMNCYKGLNLLTINRLRKNGEPSIYKNAKINDFWTEDRKSDWAKHKKAI